MTRSSSKTSAETAIRYNGKMISFALVRTKTKRLTISVCPNLAVEVKAPKDRSLTQIKARVEHRAAWIARQVEHFRQAPPAAPKRRYVSGETHVFLGRQYRLKIHPADHSSVKLIGRYLHVLTPTPYRVGELVEDWYRDHAKQLLHRRVQQCYDNVKRFGIPLPAIRLKKMYKRWGSCTPTASIILNTELIKAPSQCIDYVIVHELCHLLIHGHNERFRRLLTACMPDWKLRKRRLESVIVTMVGDC
jgi:predicted metal-dependent hydrolase